MTMTIGLAVAYAVAIVIGLVVCAQLYPLTSGSDGLKMFGVAATVVVAAISAVMTGIVSLYSLHRNNLGQLTLKRLENDLLNTRESAKGTKDAYEALLTAATTAHGALTKMQSNRWDKDQRTIMENAFTTAAPKIIYVRNEADEATWLKIQHRGMFLAEKAEKLSDPKGQAELWRTSSAPFSEALATFQSGAQAELRRGTGLDKKNGTEAS